MGDVRYRVFEVVEYLVDVDPKHAADVRQKASKCTRACLTDEDYRRREAHLKIGRKAYVRRTEVKRFTFKEGEPPLLITINDGM